jgi:hypothetical protein
VQEAFIARFESVPVIFKRGQRNWRIAESRMPFETKRLLLRNIASRHFKSIVITALRDRRELCGRGRRSINRNRSWM